MKIEGPDYIITGSTNDYNGSFDLQLLQAIKSKTNPRSEMQPAGYGLSLSRCVQYIVANRVSRKIGEDSVTLEEYMKQILQVSNEFKKQFDEYVSA